jgi:hypothetical protein
MSKIDLGRGQLTVVRSKDHLCWTAGSKPMPGQINNLLPTCGNIAPAYVTRFSTKENRSLTYLVKLVK